MDDRKIEIEISARLDNINREFGKLESLARATATKVDTAFAGVGTSLKSSLAGLAAGVSVGAFAAFVKNAVDMQDSLNDLSKKTGVTVEDLAGLSLAAKKSGSDLDSIAAAVNKLSVNMGKEPEKFKAIGISAKDPIEALKQLADVFVRIKDPQQRAAFAAEALGKSWAGAAPLLAEGGKSIGEMVEKGKTLSKVSADSAAKADELNDRLEELRAASSGLGVELGNRLVPSLTDTAKAMEELASKGSPALSMLRGFAGLGKLPFDLAFGDVDMSVGGMVKDLEDKLKGLQEKREAYNPFSLWGDSLKEIDQQILVTKNQLEALKKFGDQIGKKPAATTETELAGPPAGLANFLNGNGNGKPKTPKPKADDPFADFMADIETRLKPAEQALDSFRQMQRDVAAEAGNLTAAEKKFFDLVASPEWQAMGEPWRDLVTAEFEAANAAESAAAAQKKLNELVADTPSSKWQAFTADLTLLQKALADGQIELSKYEEAVQALADKNTEKLNDQKDVAKELGMTFTSAFEDAIVEGKKFSDVLDSLYKDILRILARKNITEPLANAVGSINWSKFFSANADGGIYSAPALSAYSGRIVSHPTVFPFANGIGLMGEAGSEAILPLKRGSSGKLGVEASVGSPQISIVVNNTASDTASADVRTRQNPNNGLVEVEVLIQKVLAGDLSRNGPVTRGIAGAFGLSRSA